MSNILLWQSVAKDNWSYRFINRETAFLAYKINRLPDFTEHRFEYLCKEVDDRQKEVAKRQLSMIRQFYGLGDQWAISLRMIKKEQSITLYLLFRYAGNRNNLHMDIANADQKIMNALMKQEYSFEKVKDLSKEDGIIDVSWASEVADIIKQENEFTGDKYPNGSCMEFYVPYSWNATENDMEKICSALLNHQGMAAVEVTIIPSVYLNDEKLWMNTNIGRLKECMNGEVIKGANGKTLWQGQKQPILKTPLDNSDKMNKQFETSRVFLSSIRVFADSGVEPLANAFLVNCVRSSATMQIYKSGFKAFSYIADCYRNVDISAACHSAYWNKHRNDAPYRAQRLSRLNSLEEISNFFRLPIPIKPGFPGFLYDTGLGVSESTKKERSIIRVGNYLDVEQTDNSAQFDSQQLAKHGLIVGVPGSGKTTAMFNILYQLWAVPEEQRIPFIILEPAKTEYRALKTLDVFKEDMLVFTLGDEGVSPFRFNPLEVLPGINIESHISRLQACFIGAFNLFDPLPIFLEQAIRRTYLEKGWYDDSVGGEPGLETPTLSDLCRNAEYIISNSGFDQKMRSDFQASLLERLNSLRRGSKGRMLDTKHTIPMNELMHKPIVMELDSLNGDEKSLMMMFLLSYVFEYCKVQRKSGSPLLHMLLVEEAHNLIGAQGTGSDNRANPKAQTIELFVNMLAEMRALGEGILIADQLPTAIAAQAVKQTNVKILMRITAKDDREEIGNTMDLNEEQLHQVVKFKTGHAYIYHEGEDRVRSIRMVNFKAEHDVEEPPSDRELKNIMSGYEESHHDLYMPFPECTMNCRTCNRRVRNQAESFVTEKILNAKKDVYRQALPQEKAEGIERFKKAIPFLAITRLLAIKEAKRIKDRYGTIGEEFGVCVYTHLLNMANKQITDDGSKPFDNQKKEEYYKKYIAISKGE